PARAVRDRHVVGPQGAQLSDGVEEVAEAVLGLRREELEGEHRAVLLGEQLVDAHAAKGRRSVSRQPASAPARRARRAPARPGRWPPDGAGSRASPAATTSSSPTSANVRPWPGRQSRGPYASTTSSDPRNSPTGSGDQP